MPENGESPGGLHNPQDPTNPQPPSKSSVHLEATVGRWPDASTDEAGAPSYPILTAPGSGRVTNWKQEQTTWQQFVERLGQVASVKECGGYVLGDFGGDGQRLKSRCRSRWAVTLDYDDGTDPGLIDRLLATGYRAAWYSSFSHKLPGKGHRYRVIVPLNRPVVGQDDYQTVAAALVDLLGAEGLDPASYLVSQLMFWPSAADLALHEQGVCTGPLADTATLLVDGALSEHRSASTPDAVAVYDGPAYAELGRAHQEQADAYVRSLLDTWRARLADAWDWPEGAQDEAGRGWEALAYQSAYSLAKVAVHPAYPLTAEEAEDEYRLALGPIGEDEHCAGKWPKALSKAESEPPEAPKWAPEPGEVFQGEGSAPRHLDELRIAEYAARTFLGDYCWAGRWHHWTGSVWAEATEVTVTEVVRQGLVRLVTDELAAGAEDARRGALVRLLSAGKLRAITGMARGLVERDPAKFDADPLLLNTPSGVVNLRTGAVQPHDPALMMTKITKHPYMPGATHPDWTKALEALEPAEIDWFQRFMGQAATGVMSPEDRLLVMQGGGANGKTTVCSALSSSLGSYATTVPRSCSRPAPTITAPS